MCPFFYKKNCSKLLQFSVLCKLYLPLTGVQIDEFIQFDLCFKVFAILTVIGLIVILKADVIQLARFCPSNQIIINKELDHSFVPINIVAVQIEASNTSVFIRMLTFAYYTFVDGFSTYLFRSFFISKEIHPFAAFILVYL